MMSQLDGSQTDPGKEFLDAFLGNKFENATLDLRAGRNPKIGERAMFGKEGMTILDRENNYL